ncbi:Bacillopeptidase F [Orchesella cincta]|uniref:Bacillopeptidase F n=1 Tax=Orchesella cincta TaxID=48709 RepID=A0A1D2M596_ORCCI|nr:Bacillopeptidase F [Orchesella cincta]
MCLWQMSSNGGVAKIEADKAWGVIGGLQKAGQGVIIATVDTGVRGTHEALRDNFVGEYGWFDPSTRDPTPTDNNGHGTHTTGTIAGQKGIGVAPAAKWAACRGCAGFFCAQSDLIACGQFFACPTLADGTSPDCSKAPNLVSNSWGGGRGNTWFNGVIEGWHAAGIIPLFSIGNSGPSCTGTIALLQTRQPELTYAKAKDLLQNHSDRELTFSGRVCDGVGDNVFPNHVFGHGRINALKSVQQQSRDMA